MKVANMIEDNATRVEREIAHQTRNLSGSELMEVAVGLLARAFFRTVEKEGRAVANVSISSVKSLAGGMWLDNLRAAAKEGKPLV